MGTENTRKPPGRASHTTLTPVAARAATALSRSGFLPYPGVINPKGGRGGTPRIIVTAEPGRVRIGIAGNGHQEVLVYGTVERAALVECLTAEFGENVVTVRDPHGLWSLEDGGYRP